MRRLLYRWTGNLPLRIISDNDRPYLERYFLFKRAGNGWVVKEPGVRVLTGTSFEMRTDGGVTRINVYLRGVCIAGPFNKSAEAEQAAADYINLRREMLVAFGFIGQETRTRISTPGPPSIAGRG
jgi:hypothetical protein